MGETGRGILALAVACTIWGLSPIYYSWLLHVPAAEVVAWRILWSLAFFAGVLAVQGRLAEIGRALRGGAGRIALASLLISANWVMFIWSIGHDRATEASLGYFLFPLVSVLLGRTVLGERLARAQWAAVTLAALAVAVLTLGLGVAPWAALFIATTFGLYGLMKARLDLGPVVSVTAEMLVLAPVAVIWIAAAGAPPGAHGAGTHLLLALSGPLTATPLILFSHAARRVRLSTVGLMQYINPSLQFLCAVLWFAEPLGPWHALAFPMIWLALALYSAAGFARDRADRRRASSAGTSSASVT